MPGRAALRRGASGFAAVSIVLAACSRNEGAPAAAGAEATRAPEAGVTPDALGVFEDVTAASGIRHVYENGEDKDRFSILESIGGGGGLIDSDQDGRLDVFLTGGGDFGPGREILGLPNTLHRNESDWRFRDVTAEAGLEGPLFYTGGCAVADHDDDGWPDLLVTGYGRVCLYRNERGKFADVTAAAGLPADVAGPSGKGTFWATSAGWGDLDRDGSLDLYITHYVDWSWDNDPRCEGAVGKPRDVCGPKVLGALDHQLFLGSERGVFRDATAAAGLVQGEHGGGKGLGVLVADLDDDGWLDVYVANDTTDNFLYMNNWMPRALGALEGGEPYAQQKARADLERLAARSGPAVRAALDAGTPAETRALLEKELAAGAWFGFEEVATERGVARDDNGIPNGSMGVDAADYDGSGRFSLFVTNFENEPHGLYRSLPSGQFHYQSRPAGIAAINLVYVGFGTGFLDYDRDGDEDLFFTNGHAFRFPAPPGKLAQQPVLLRNLRLPGQEGHKVRFENASRGAGPYFQLDHRGRGVALGDLDDDGKVDLVVSHQNAPAAVLRNVSADGNHWLGVELVGKPTRDAIGAVLTLEVGGQRLLRQVKGGASFLSSSDRRVVFGLGQASEVGELSVRWPSGAVQTWTELAVDRYWRLTEGVEQPQAAKR